MLKKFPVWFRFLAVAMGIEFLRSFLPPLAYYLDAFSVWLSYPVHILSETAGFFLLTATLGLALGASRRSVGYGLLYLGLAAGVFLVGGFFSLLWQALFLERGITGLELSMLLGSALDSSFLPLAVVFLIGYFAFIAKYPEAKAKDYRDFASPAVRAMLVASALLLVYRLIGQTLATIDFISTSGFLYFSETLTIILDYLLILATAVAGYLVTFFARKQYLRAAREYEEYLSESKKEND